MDALLKAPLASMFALANLENKDIPHELRQRITPWAMDSPRENIHNGPGPHCQSPTREISQGRDDALVQTSQMYSLPTEIVLQITQYMSLGAKLSLSRTCHRFRMMIDAYIGDLFPPIKKSDDNAVEAEVHDNIQAQFDFLCVIERDRVLQPSESPSRLVCSTCLHTYPLSFFSTEARR